MITAANETTFATSLNNSPSDTAHVTNRLRVLAERMEILANAGSWDSVNVLAQRIEQLAYRAKLDARKHSIMGEI